MTGGVLPTKRVAKPWGRDRLPAPFDDGGDERIGEIWFQPPERFDALLAKYLFTSEKLSVQVHPSDAQAGDGCGKEECWLILEAEPGARLAAGFREPVTPERMWTAAIDGTIEDLLAWHEVSAGDFLYIPAGTVHAIGPGIALVEIQQNCDTTYRLYDYGRPRELHLEAAIAAAQGEVHPTRLRRNVDDCESCMLVDGPFFRIAHVRGTPDEHIMTAFAGNCLVLPLRGEVRVDGRPIAAGAAGWAEDIAELTFASDGRYLLAGAVIR